MHNPEVVEVTPLSARKLQVTGVRHGTTTLVLWDDKDQVHWIDVEVQLVAPAERWSIRGVLGDDFALEVKHVLLAATAATDADLHRLVDLPDLVELDLLRTNVSGVAVDELRKALPKCKIHFWER